MDVIGNLRFLNLGNGELQNAIIERLASDPTASTGRIYYNTTDNEYRFYNGTSWLPIGSGADISALQTEVDNTQTSMGYVNTDGTFNPTPLNLLDNVAGLSGGSPTSSLVDALTQLDAAITAAADTGGADKLGELLDVTLAAGSPQEDRFLVSTASGGSPAVVYNNLTAPNARVKLNAVNRAGDTMTGSLEFESGNRVIVNGDGGSPVAVAAPSYAFGSPADTGFFHGTVTSLGDEVDFVGVSVNGTQIARFEHSGSPEIQRLFVVDELTVTDGAIITDQNSSAAAPGYTFLGDEDTGMFHDTADEVAFSRGGREALRIEADGTVSVAGSPQYEGLVTDDDDLPNKKYVDDAILAATPALGLDDLTDVTVTGPEAVNSFLVYTAASPAVVQNRTAAQSRTALGLDSGGAGDIWVEKSGDTMTGDLTMSGGDILAQAGSLSNPPISFAADENTGLFRAGEDEIDVVAGGTSRLKLQAGQIRTSEEVMITAAGEAPQLRFGDTATGSPSTVFITSSTGDDIQFAVGNATRAFFLEADGTISVQSGGSPEYENLVTNDDDIPNKKYVDDAITTGVGASNLGELLNVTDDSTTADQFLVTTGSQTWGVAGSPVVSLGLNAGGTNDIWVEKAGDSMTGALAMGTNKITGLADGTDPADAVNKSQLDAAQAGILVKEQCRLATNQSLHLVGNGNYVAAGSGVGKTLTATNTGTTTIDGVQVADGDRVLVKDEPGSGSPSLSAVDHGIYVVSNAGAGSATVLTRATDFDGTPTGEVQAGNFTFIEEGTANDKTGWVLLDTGFPGSPNAATVDTDALNFTQFQGLPQFQGGDGIDITGDVVSVDFGPGTVAINAQTGIDIRNPSTSALILTLDGTTRDTTGVGSQPTAAAELALLVGSGLTQDATGLFVDSSTITGDTGSTAWTPGTGITFAGGSPGGITFTVGSPLTITANIQLASATQKGIAEFDATDFTVTAGDVALNQAGVQALIAQPVLLNTGSPAAFVQAGNGTLDLIGDQSAFGLPGSPQDGTFGSPAYEFPKQTVVTPNRDVTLTSNGTDSVTFALNAFLGDLQDVGGYGGDRATDPYFGGAADTLVSYRMAYNAYYNGELAYYLWTDGYQNQYGSSEYFDRGTKVLAWDGGSWVASSFFVDGSSVASNNNDWFTRYHSRRYDPTGNVSPGTTFFVTRNGRGWNEGGPFSGIAGSPLVGTDSDVFARYDNTNREWRNFTLRDIMRGINTVDDLQITNIGGSGVNQDLFETFTADAGSRTAGTPTENFTFTGGTGISTSIAGSTMTITNDSPNVDQNLFQSITGDSGTTTASTTTDSVRLRGGTGITTTASDTGGSPQAQEVAIDFSGSLNDLSDVSVSSAAIGEVLAVSATGSPSTGVGDFENKPIYAESGLRSASTSHVWAHNLNQKYVTVTVLDSSDQVIIPNSITMTDEDQVTVTFGSSIQCRIIAMGVPTVVPQD